MSDLATWLIRGSASVMALAFAGLFVRAFCIGWWRGVNRRRKAK